MFAIPNGGLRNKTVAGKLKAEGARPGVLDVFLAVPNRKYHGLFIEMKYGRNKLTEHQRTWKMKLEAFGYCCIVVKDWTRASEFILRYLEDRE